MSNAEQIADAVKGRYGKAAREVLGGGPASCCSGESECGTEATISGHVKDFITRDLYDADAVSGIPLMAHLASLGCGNPTALATLQHGEVVLDLGSGGGIDVLISAKRVGSTGHVTVWT